MKKSIFLFFAAILCATSTWAGVSGGDVYFDPYSSGWGNVSSIEYVISHDGYSRWYKMSNISNTQLYYIASDSWSDAKYIAFTANFGWTSGESNKYENRLNYAPSGGKYTKKNSYGVNSGSTYLFYASSSSNNATIQTSSPAGYLSSGYTALNYKQTVKQELSIDEGNTFSASTEAIASVKVSSYKLTQKSTATADSKTISSGSSSANCEAARTATVTYTVSNINSDYTFVGWYDGTTQKSTSTTYTYNATEAKTITARFSKEPKHPVTVSYKCGSTDVKLSETLEVGEFSAQTVTAEKIKDYTFSGWTLGSGVQSADENANPISITTKASGEYTLVANYDYIEPVIKTIYCKMEHSWWTQASAAISAFISGTDGESATSLGTLMTLAPLEGNVWKIDVDVARYQKIRFIRVNPEGTSDWGARTGLVEIPTDDKNLYTITQSSAEWSGECSGTWSVYEAPVTAPKRYITGNKELVGGEGWKANEIEMTYDNGTSTYSHTFLASALTAGTEYKLKVTEGNWDGGKWGSINGTIPGVSNDGDGNVCFKLSTVGDVTVTFDGAKITVSTTGAFKVPVTYPYYILGTMNSWSVEEEYGLADEDEDGVYTREITLAAGEHFFKINIGNWDSQWGWSNVVGAYTEATDASDDNKIKITLASEKTFTVEFNQSKNQISFDGLTKIEDYYTVVGVAELFGEAWSTKNEANKMAKQGDGSYKLVKENVTLAAIGYDWKIAKNGDWWNDAATGVNPSEGNNTLTITTAGRYNVTFTLAADLTSATVETELLEAAVVIPDCFISGNKNLTGKETEWQGNEFTMVYDDETETWSYTLAGLQPEKAYELKVVCGGTWYSYADLASIPTGVTEGNDHSIAFKMAAAGDVVVTYNVEAGITLSGNFAEPTTTSLDNLNTTVAPVKMIENGQLFVIKNGVKYNVLGAIVK